MTINCFYLVDYKTIKLFNTKFAIKYIKKINPNVPYDIIIT